MVGVFKKQVKQCEACVSAFYKATHDKWPNGQSPPDLGTRVTLKRPVLPKLTLQIVWPDSAPVYFRQDFNGF